MATESLTSRPLRRSSAGRKPVQTSELDRLAALEPDAALVALTTSRDGLTSAEAVEVAKAFFYRRLQRQRATQELRETRKLQPEMPHERRGAPPMAATSPARTLRQRSRQR